MQITFSLKKNVLYNVLGGLWEAGDTGQPPVADLLTNTGKRGKYCSLFEIMKLLIPQKYFFPFEICSLRSFGFNFNFSASSSSVPFFTCLNLF